MVDPLSVIGAIAGCQQLASRLIKVIRELSGAETEKSSMILRLDHHLMLLHHFSELLVDFDTEFDSDRRDHFDLVIKHMQIILENTLVRMEKLKNKKPSRLLWSFVGTDLKAAERELFDWSQRLMIAFAFMSTRIKTSFVKRSSDTADLTGLPSWLSGLWANIRMEEGKVKTSTIGMDTLKDSGSTALEKPTPRNSIDKGRMQELWIDHIDTTFASRRGAMTMDEVRLEVSRLFAVLKQADALSTHILTAKHLLITDDENKLFQIASGIPDDTCKQQLLSEMLLEPPQHVSFFPLCPV
jgi:hypothetical protein